MSQTNHSLKHKAKEHWEEQCVKDPTHYSLTPRTGQSAENLIASAKLKLMMDFPFWGKIISNMPLIESEYIPTTAVDAKGNFYFNRYWVNAWDSMEVAVFMCAHEAGHIYQRFFSRLWKGVIHHIFNMAADWRVNTDLLDAGFPENHYSREVLSPEDRKKANELGTCERIYQYMLTQAESVEQCLACKKIIQEVMRLQQQQDKQNKQENKEINESDEQDQNGTPKPVEGEDGGESCKSNSGAGDPGDSSDQPEHTCGGGKICCVGTSGDLSKGNPMDEQKWLERVIAAKMHAEGKGKMPGHLGEQINALTKSTVRWQDYLKSKSTKIFGRDRYSFKKYNRRGACMGVRLPRALPDAKTAIIACDTSGSMSEDSIRQCITESAAIMKTCGASKIWLILHDCDVSFSGYVTESDLTNLKCSRGGTSHEPVFQILHREHPNSELDLPPEENAELAILFTDLGTDFPDFTPPYEVIWGVPEPSSPGMSANVPFGTKVAVPVEA